MPTGPADCPEGVAPARQEAAATARRFRLGPDREELDASPSPALNVERIVQSRTLTVPGSLVFSPKSRNDPRKGPTPGRAGAGHHHLASEGRTESPAAPAADGRRFWHTDTRFLAVDARLPGATGTTRPPSLGTTRTRLLASCSLYSSRVRSRSPPAPLRRGNWRLCRRPRSAGRASRRPSRNRHGLHRRSAPGPDTRKPAPRDSGEENHDGRVAGHAGEAVQPDHVYVIPPDALLTVHEGLIEVKRRTSAPERPFPVDLLFSSLAVAYGEGAIGVVLSGARCGRLARAPRDQARGRIHLRAAA